MFSGAMVCALLDGRKAQTRRLATSPLAKTEVGDVLWVRETFAKPFSGPNGYIYRADGPEFRSLSAQAHQWGAEARWTPAIHMPRVACRLLLNVTGVRIEPLHVISEEDAAAEGVEQKIGGWRDYQDPTGAFPSARDSYASLWASLHGESSWRSNPDVLVLSFERAR